MSEARRRELVAVAERHDVVIIEDDVYGPMLGTRAPAIVTLAPERTYHISALSKALAPGLRVGYLLCPPGRALVTAEAVRTTAWMPAPLPLLVASRWLEDGTANAILKAQLAELRARHMLVTTDPCRPLLQCRSALHVHLAAAASALASGGFCRQCCAPMASRSCRRRPSPATGSRWSTPSASMSAAPPRARNWRRRLRIIASTLADRPRALIGHV